MNRSPVPRLSTFTNLRKSEEPFVPKWSCEETKGQRHCRNPHGCHCAEIASLLKREEKLKQILREAVDQEAPFGPQHPKWFNKAKRAVGMTERG
jgi:hypothetical protein